MAAAPPTAWVYSHGRDSFPVLVPAAGITARSLRALIEVSPTGKDMLFAAGSWGVFLAREGAKHGAKLEDLTLITLTAGEVNVWVERVVAPGAGGARDAAAAGGAAGGEGGAATDLVTRAELNAAIADAAAKAELIQRLNPFAVSHHSDSISIASTPGSEHFPDQIERVAFKWAVVDFYGLRVAGSRHTVTDMLGDEVPFRDATLAHIWPASYTNWGEACENLALPGDFYKDPRNFLLLPKALHDAFDRGSVILVPSSDAITIRVIRPALVDAALHPLDGRQLQIPQKGAWPYKRVLAFFALQAKGNIPVDAGVEGAIRDSLSASESEDGNASVQQLAQVMERISKLTWHHPVSDRRVAAAAGGAPQGGSSGWCAVRLQDVRSCTWEDPALVP